MKINNQSLFDLVDKLVPSVAYRVKKYLSIVLVTCLVSLTSACQMTAPSTQDSVSYNQYYLWLKNQTNKGVLAEEKQLKILINNQYRDDQVLNQGKLILIYSLPNTKLHSPYKAKRLLNEHLLSGNNISKENFAFIMLLRDQLNSQLNLLSKHKTASKACKEQYHEHHKLIEQLELQLKQVNQQLLLLKKIDRNINDRG